MVIMAAHLMEICAVLFVSTLTAFTAAEEWIVTTIKEPPYVQTKVDKPTRNSEFEGYIPDLLNKIANKTSGLTFKLQLVQDGKYGVEHPNEGWNGMIGEVMSQKAKFAGAPITISDERKRAVDFTDHWMTFDTVVLLKKGDATKNIRQVADLAKQTDIKLGVVKDGFTERFFKESNVEIYKQMYAGMDKNSLPGTSAEGVRKVLDSDGKYAFIIEESTADYWINKECSLRSFRLGHALDDNKYAFAIRQGDREVRDELNRAISALMGEGELERLRAKWWPKECNAGSRLTFQAVFIFLLAAFVARL